jgi:hypothetical protein
VSPPLTIEAEELGTIAEALDHAVAALGAGGRVATG